jgi:hypothetical protein
MNCHKNIAEVAESRLPEYMQRSMMNKFKKLYKAVGWDQNKKHIQENGTN